MPGDERDPGIDPAGDDGDAPALCERCGVHPVSEKFRGWKHYGDEGEWLCEDCHATATMEE